jgi:hypothetical protein
MENRMESAFLTSDANVEPRGHVVAAGQWCAYSLAWPAYVRILTNGLVRAVLLGALPLFIMNKVSQLTPYASWWPYVGVALVLAGVVYDFLSLRAVRLYTDHDGVWLESGVLPWNRGTLGVKWRDVSEASCQLGFWAWLTRSYTVRVGHRFTNGTELVVRNVWRGKDAAGHINDVLMNPRAYMAR